MERAENPATGEVLFKVNGQWVPPSQTAKNPDTGEMAYEVNGQWEVVPAFKTEAPKAEMPSLGFGAEDIKKGQQQLREEPIIGLPRRQASAPVAPVVAPPAPPAPAEGLGALMANVPKQKALPSATLPVTPEERRRINDMWAGATPEQRKVLEAKPGYIGFIARELAGSYPTEVPKGVLAELDPRREAKEIVKARQELPQKPSTDSEIVKGAKSATNSLKMLPTTLGLQADANIFGRATNELTGFDQIDRGEITNIDQASKRLADTTLAYKYLNGTPEERQAMRAQRVNEVKDSQISLQQAMVLYQKFQQDNQKYRGKTQDLTDVNTVKDFGNWLAYNFGSGAVQLAPVMLAAVATGGTGAFLTGTALAGQETIGNRLEFLQDKVKDLPPNKQADAIIDYLAKSGDTTTLVSLASGALDLAGPAGTIIRKRFEKEGLKSLVKSLEKETAIKAAKQAPREIAEEAITGGAQEATQIAGKRSLGEQTGDILSEENIKAVINAAAAEGVGGAAGSAFNVGRAGLQQLREQPVEPTERIEPSVGDVVPTGRKEPTLDNIVNEPKAPSGITEELTAPPGLVEEAEIEQPSIKEAFQGAAKGMTENLYQGIFEAQQKGETKVSGIDEPVLIAAKEAGITFKTPEEVQAFANDPKVQARLKEINVEQQVQRMVQNGQTVGQIQQKLPNVDVLKMLGVIDKLPMGDNVEYHIVKTQAGYAANMFDVDSGNYVPGSTRIFSTKNFGDQAEAKAREFAQGEVNKVKPEAPVEEPQEETIKVESEKPEVKSWINKVYEKFPQTFQNNHVIPLGGEGENQQFGMVELTPSLSKRGAVEVKFISAYPQRQGVGTRAMEVLKNMAREDGISLTLYAWDKGQVSQGNLIKFYKKQGFTPISKGSKTLVWTPEAKSKVETSAEQAETTETPAVTPEGAPPLTEDEINKLFEEMAEEPEAPAAEGQAPQQFSEEQIDKMLEEIAAGETPSVAPTPKEKPLEKQTIPELLGGAAKSTGSGLEKAVEGLSQLFGADNTTLRSGIGFDPETYEKAKPHFLQALSDFKDAASRIKEVMKKLYDMVVAKKGKEFFQKIKPYMTRFIMDVQSGAVKYEAPTEQVEEAKPDLLTPEGKFQVAQELADYLIGDGSFKTIVEARQKIAEITGQKIEPGTELAKQADETVETAIVLAARDIVKAGRKRGNNVTYDRLVGLLGRQPNLATRSSESIRDQAYSTPVPLAYLASELAGVTPESKVLEPTAGNGMLLIGASVNNAIANELNPTRAAMMRALGFTVTTQNAATSELTKPKSQDVVIANPPFGSTKDADGKTISFTVKDGYTTNEIDHAIVFKSLEAMKDDGRAVLIVGGVLPTTEEGRTDAYRGAAKRAFYYNLYNQYNVVDHFTVAGDLYAKQGASYPVDVIVIEGRGESERSLPAADLPKIYNSWDELKEKLNGRVVPTRNERPAGTPSGENQAGAGNGEGVAGGTGGQGAGTGGEGGTKGVTPSEQGAGPAGGRPGGRGTEPSTRKLEPSGVPEGGGNRQEGVPSEGGVQPGSIEGTTGNEPTGVGGPSGITGERVGSGIKDRRGAETETATQVEYVPRSGASSVGTLSPVAMQQATQEALDRIVEQHGDIDNYVAEALAMDPEDLRLNFSAEQVDALALAISNAQEGKGFIIGDQTGIGKGRVVAAMIKYALVNDKIPIFVTEKPNLYADMIRDLDDIGMTNELGLDQKTTKIFMTNSSDSVPYTIVREKDGEVTETNFTLKAPAKGKDLNDLMVQMQIDNSLGNPPFYKVIFTTYSQLQAVRKNTTERQRFINHFAAGNYIILDESHNAGGAGEAKGKKGEEKEEVTGRAGFVRGLVQRSFGSFFSSATYAKRPDVMSLYSSTNMSLAVNNPSQLGEAIKNGGVPMQQAVATMLTKDGQYIRRERTFAGVSYDTVPAEVDKDTAENMASAMRSILAFSRAKEGLIKEIQKDFDKRGEVAGQAGERTTVQSANFGSIMHNLIDQMLLALKVQQAVKQAIDLLKAGEKPVLTVSNTMGSFLADYAEEMGLRTGDPVSLSFKDMYMRYLKKQRIIKVKTPNGQVNEVELTDDELGPTLTEAYNQIANQIENAGFGSAPISPIDYIHNELRKAGYKTDEITGRTVTVNYDGDTPVLGARSSSIRNRVNAVRGFNNGTLDALILNQAGSTGLSLHASSKVRDQKKRHMIIVQAEKNIDTHMQMLGRVHRTGQVIAPAYSQMMADIPAEMRPASVLMKKMASLNANTTASRKSAVTAEGVVDFMNDYGGQVAQEFLRDNPEIHNKLGGSKVLPLDEDPSEDADEGDIRKLTGYIPILPIEEQEHIYTDLVARYNELITLEDTLGTNKLEAKAMDLDAKTLSAEPITEQKPDLSLFAAPAIMERIDVKRTVKPYSIEEVNQIVQERLNGEQPAAIAREQDKEMRERAREYYREVTGKLESQDKPDPVKIQTAQDAITASVNRTSTILQNYRIGTQVSIKDKLGQRLYGVITNVTNSKRTENPAAGSDWKISFAVSNGEAKTLTLSFSQIGTTKYELSPESTVNWYNPETQKGEDIPLMQTFEKGATVRREKRWLISGNLLAGFALYPGQIISYTKEDETTGQGILMSRQFDWEKVKSNAPVVFTNPQEIIEFLNFKNTSEIGTPDRHLTIRRDRSSYLVSASKPKRSGGLYHQDPNLIEIVGQFYGRGDRLGASVYQEEKLINAINYLNQKGVQLIATGNQVGAREAREQKLKGSAPSGSLSANAQTRYMSGRRSSTKMSKADIEKQIQSVRERGQVPEIVVVQGIDNLPENILNEMRASEMELAPGLFHQDSNRIFLIADNIAHPQALWMTVAHELAGHYGLRAVLGEDYAPMMNAIYDGSEEVRKNVDARLQRNRDQVKNPNLRMTKEEAVEEYVAEKAEPDPKLKWVNRLVNAIKTFLRKIGFTIPVGDSEVIRLIRDANKYTYGDAIKASWTVREAAKGREKGFARGAVRPSLATSAKDRFEAAEIERLDEPGFKSRERLVEINIDDFLNLSDQVTEGAYTGGKLKDTRSYLKDGGKFNSLPFFQYDIDDDNVAHVIGHEGRHRALALKELGYTTMPVILRGPIRWSEQADPNKFDYVEEFPTRLRAQEKAQNPNFTITFPVTRETADQPYSASKSRAIRPSTPKVSSNAPEWVSQKVWDLHEKARRAEAEASGDVPLRPNSEGRVPRPQDLKREQVMTFRRLNKAVEEYLGTKNFNDVNDLMVRMNQESSRRENESGDEGSSRIMYRQDDEDLVDKYNRPNVPMLKENPVTDWVIDAAKSAKKFLGDAVVELANGELDSVDQAFTGVEAGILHLRNKNVFSGTGLNARDFDRYKGALQDSQGIAVASVALDNALASGNIGVQVVMQGGLKFDTTHQRFMAMPTTLGMVGVYKAQADLKKRLGKQLGENIIQGYLEAKRSKSIKDEYAIREQEYKDAVDAYNRALQQPDVAIQLQAKETVDEASEELASIKVALEKVNMSDEEIVEFIAREQVHPELRTIMSNWTAVNQNLLKIWKQVGLLSDKRYEVLSQIPDYVPWYRIMSDDEDGHSPIQSTTKTLQNIGREKIFKAGKAEVVNTFTAQANQQQFEIQPSTNIGVKVNGKKIPASKVTATSDGFVTLNIVINSGDQVVITANREIDNIIDNMTQNVMRMTMNAIRQYAANRIVKEYGTRNSKGQIMQFKRVDPDKGRFYFVSKGRRIIVEIQDLLVAEAIFGLKALDLTMWKPMAMVANLTRRLITSSGAFQLKQIFQDAPTAALVSGVKNPLALMGGVFNGFIQALRPNDPIVQILKSAGIGGFYTAERTPEAEVKRRIGVLNKNVYDYVMRGLDHWGDASDMAQRRAVYIRVLKETGDANLALWQASNVINFLRRGSGETAQALTKTVPFMAAYANQIDVLAQTLIGGGLKGVSRGRALARLGKTGALLSSITLLYCFLVGDDEDYIKLDDQTRIRNFILPGTTFVIPMNTAAGFFFKAIPEMLYNTVVKYGTENEIDARRLRTAMKEAAKDMLLGPTPLPSVVKTVVEIKLNKDFWSGKEITPKRLENVDAAEQYTAATSELGKTMSKISGGALNPMEMDHIVKSTFGSAGAMAQYFTNLIGEASGERAETPLKQTPLVGPFVRPEVPRGPEDLFYDLKEEVDTKYKTFEIKLDRLKDKEAEKYEKENESLIGLHDTLEGVDDELKELNKQIREAGEAVDKSRTPKQKRDEMNLLSKEKNKVLDDIELLRKEADFSKDSIIHEILNRVSQ